MSAPAGVSHSADAVATAAVPAASSVAYRGKPLGSFSAPARSRRQRKIDSREAKRRRDRRLRERRRLEKARQNGQLVDDDTVDKALATTGTDVPPDTDQQGAVRLTVDKPREERSYKDFFADLDVVAPLELQWVPGQPQIEQAESGADDAGQQTNGQFSSPLTSVTNIVGGVVDKIIQRAVHQIEHNDEQEAVDTSATPSEAIAVDDATSANDVDAATGWRPALPGPILFMKNGIDAVPRSNFELLDDATAEKSRQLFASLPAFSRPDGHYLRQLEPSEDDLKRRVEYDMDEQDLCWLKLVNEQRGADDLPPISNDIFELVIDQLEKHWFNLTKDLQKPHQEAMTHEESICNICHSDECENSNAIVFCDGCNLAVHQECYGVPYIPEGQWLCRKCMVHPESPVACLFCPNEGGAFKQTTGNQWAHLLCSIWIPEVAVANPVYMEPIEGVERVPKSRWKLICSLCKQRRGACIQCSKSSCFTAFHVSCARKAALYMKVKHNTTDGNDHATYRVFCGRHSPSNWEHGPNDVMNIRVNVSGEEHSVEEQLPIEDEMDVSQDEVDVETNGDEQQQHQHQSMDKSARAYQHGFSQSLPIAPEFVVRQISQYLDDRKIALRQKQRFIVLVCKFWSQKRAARRGAPLLKRLHLEPWTAFSSSIRQDEAHQLERLRILSHIRTDLEKVRMLAELVRKREKEKLKSAQVQLESLYLSFAPLSCILRRTVEAIKKLDKRQLFMDEVSAEEVPDYRDIIKQPMDFGTITDRINNFVYVSFEDFEADVMLIYTNAVTYNKPDTLYARVAHRMRSMSLPLLANAKASWEKLQVDPGSGCLSLDTPTEMLGFYTHYPPPRAASPIALVTVEEVEVADEAEAASPATPETPVEKSKPMSKDRGKKGVTKLKAPPSTRATRLHSSPITNEDEHVVSTPSKVATEEITSPVNSVSHKSGAIDTPVSLKRKSDLHDGQLEGDGTGELIVSSKKIKSTAGPIISRRKSIGSGRRKSGVRKPVKFADETFVRMEQIRNLHSDRLKHMTKSLTNQVGGDNLVWAKLPGFPWFPAEATVQEFDNPSTAILDLKSKDDSCLGRFFDRDLDQKRTWVWMSPATMQRFDFGDEDLAKLTNLSKGCSASIRHQMIQAYYVACTSRNRDPAAVLHSAGIEIAPPPDTAAEPRQEQQASTQDSEQSMQEDTDMDAIFSDNNELF